MEAFDAALAWLVTTQLMIAFGSLGAIAFLVFWGIFAPFKASLKSFSAMVMAAFSAVIPPLVIMSAMFFFYAQDGVKAACSGLPGNIEASGIRLTSFDERDIGVHCGRAVLREIINQSPSQPVPAV